MFYAFADVNPLSTFCKRQYAVYGNAKTKRYANGVTNKVGDTFLTSFVNILIFKNELATRSLAVLYNVLFPQIQ